VTRLDVDAITSSSTAVGWHGNEAERAFRDAVESSG
jgi:hypothetical protein